MRSNKSSYEDERAFQSHQAANEILAALNNNHSGVSPIQRYYFHMVGLLMVCNVYGCVCVCVCVYVYVCVMCMFVCVLCIQRYDFHMVGLLMVS